MNWCKLHSRKGFGPCPACERRAKVGCSEDESYKIEVDTLAEVVITRYACGAQTITKVNDDDAFHAGKLGITPFDHRWLHETLHHLVGVLYYRKASSPVLWRDAHHIPQDDTPDVKPEWNEADREEWLVTNLTYVLKGRPWDAGALAMMIEGKQEEEG